LPLLSKSAPILYHLFLFLSTPFLKFLKFFFGVFQASFSMILYSVLFSLALARWSFILPHLLSFVNTFPYFFWIFFKIIRKKT
jgi:hypothetical protein